MAHNIRGYYEMSTEEQIAAEKALWDSLTSSEQEMIDQRHDRMENAVSEFYNTRYSRIIASWFNVVGDTMTAKEAIFSLFDYLKVRMDVYEYSDIHQMLSCGKAELESAMKKYLETDVQKKTYIKKLKGLGVDITGLDALPLDTLKSIADKM